MAGDLYYEGRGSKRSGYRGDPAVFSSGDRRSLPYFERAEEAFDAALHCEDKETRLLCLGSLYLVGEIKRRFVHIESEDSHD